MKVLNKNSVASSLAFVVTVFGFSQSIQAMRLEHAIGQAVHSNPEIKSNESEERAVEYQKDQEFGKYGPTLDVEHGSGFEYIHDKFKKNELNVINSKGTVDQTRHQPTVRVVQPLFSGFDTKYRVEKKEGEHSQAVKKTDESRVLVGFRAAEAYIGVRRFQRLWRIAVENVKQHKTIHRKIVALVNAGKASVADKHTVEARLEDAQTAVNDILGDLGSRIADFIKETGIHPDQLENAKIDETVLPKTLAEALDMALENNRSVVLAKSNINVAKTDVKVAQSPFYPNVNVEADATHSYNVSGKKGYENNAKALLVVRWNLFRGGSDYARHKELSERIVKAKDQLHSSLKTAEREIRVSWNERASAALQAATLRKAVASKQQVVNAFTKQFDIGKVSLLDLLDVVNEWFLAKGALVTADATQDVTEVRLLAACGTLLTALNLPNEGVPFVHAENNEKMTPTEQIVQDIVSGNIKFERGKEEAI